ncbi:Mov34/MPN/PAD-1 family protein [Pyrococcus abyssi]|uniref:Predicted metalloprotease, containing Jab1/MPN domain n=1 Tax=Pyrococcus abyssi (strain GE5 / Orsay) TaxID=272844 RepID=Q9UYC5_PYRAB|nr:Mov34/MPN/PAD-1 family protein [Pyrococcus abyssi]CAB50487.1 Hypothetical protein PAB1045 [Pyrococcus abyssi GE5]CCE71041.1 TPA: predicted metalloprotease, containing Jab1/MPN domain [Pyrococcus abyssi GE5]
MKVKIRRELLEYLLELAREFYPNEVAGFLREKDGVLEEVLLVPKGYFGSSSVYFDLTLLPHDESIKGTFHSHPSPFPYPSKGDLMFFSKFGGVHIIVAFPYTKDSVKAFRSDGSEVELEVVE